MRKVLFLLNVNLLLEIAEDIVEDKVAVWLFGKEEGLGEFAPCPIVIGHFADNEDDDTAVGGRLGIDVVNVDLALVVADSGDAVVDFL